MKFNLRNLKKINLVKLLKLDKFRKQFIILVVFTIFIGSNFLLSFLSLRLDFSKGRAYTLSNSTKNILSHLEKQVSIKFYASSDLPTKLIVIKNEVIDFLNEYNKAGRGRVSTKTLDPKKDSDALKEVQEAGIPELQFSQLEQDKYAVTTAYFGIVISFGDKKEIIAQATDLESLEYNLTAAIYKLANKNLGKVAIVGIDEVFDTTTDNLATFKKVLRQQFELSFIKDINQSYKTILFFDDNQKEYSQEEIDQIKKYLDKKGTAIFFVDGVWVGSNLQTSDAGHGLFGLLREWGVELNKNLILSASAEMVNFGNESFQFYSAYPFWIKTNNFNSKSSFFSNINQLSFPWVSSITIKNQPNIEKQELVKSTKNSWLQKNNYVLNPQAIPQPSLNDLSEQLIIVQAKKKNSGQIIIIPSSRFIQESYLSGTSDNLEFTLNILNDLISGGALSGIRQRAVSYYPLPELNENQKDIFKYLNILLFPGLLALYGVVRLTRKKN